MSWFTSPKIFSTSEKIKQALYQIESLTPVERSAVYQRLVAELDDGGVTRDELKRVVREMRLAGTISEIDKNNLLTLLD